MSSIDVVHWNPRRARLLGRPIGLGARVDNFGDLLGPLVVDRLLRRHGIDPGRARAPRRLVTVGSILHFARDGDVVWGTGVNGKITASRDYRFRWLDVRAVRGPSTRAWLRDRAISAPAVFGDPALLVPQFLPELHDWSARKRHAVTVVPNLHDAVATDDARVLDPRRPVRDCLERIARSEMVVGSSLHGTIIAESLGIPARFVRGRTESPTKYVDYYGGTGRGDVEVATSVSHALELGGAPPPAWDPQPLLDAFPLDLWQ